jgi:DNA polymerase-4
MAMTVRRILHVDMDAFFASVEQRDKPELRGQPVAVGGIHRGVVAAASYEARRFGVRSAIPMSRALRLCPQLKVVFPDFARYKAASEQVFAIFRRVTPLVEPLSLDEAYLDVTENAWNEPLGVEVARRIKQAIATETGLTASAGVAPNKFLAKIASGWRKPNGLTVIAPERVERFLAELPIDALWGVGPVTAKKLRDAGMEKLVDVRGKSEAELTQVVGSFARTLLELAHGQDHRPVEPNRERKSVGSETTFAEDLLEKDRITDEVRTLAKECTDWLARHQLFARTVTLKVRYDNFQTITRSETASRASRSEEQLTERATALLEKTAAGQRPIRLLGVSLHGLSDDDTDTETLTSAAVTVPRQGPVQLSLPFPTPRSCP